MRKMETRPGLQLQLSSKATPPRRFFLWKFQKDSSGFSISSPKCSLPFSTLFWALLCLFPPNFPVVFPVCPSGIFLLALGVGYIYIVKRRQNHLPWTVFPLSMLSSGYFNSNYCTFFNLEISIFLFQLSLWSKWEGLSIPWILLSLHYSMSFYSHSHTHVHTHTQFHHDFIFYYKDI